MVAEDSGVPAGWYPDPLGLTQLRWWDGEVWTEFTAPIDTPAAASDETDVAADAETGTVGEATESVDSDGADEVVEPAAVGEVEELSEPEAVAAADAEESVEATDSFEPESVVEPEPFDAARADPFSAAEATALEFTSRRARRAYERKLALEAGIPDHEEQPYSRLDTNPIDIQLASPAPVVEVVPVATADPVATIDDVADLAVGPAVIDTPPNEQRPQQEEAPPAVSAPVTAEPEAPEGETPKPGFSLEAVEVSPEAAPARTLIAKRTYGGAAYLLAMLPPLAMVGVIAVQLVPDVTATSMLAWSIGIAAWLIGVLVAFLDASSLRRWGHERTASPLWALLTPIVYLSVRAVATRRETGHGRAVVLAWVLGLVLTAVLAYLFPDVLELLVPGFVPTWTSILA